MVGGADTKRRVVVTDQASPAGAIGYVRSCAIPGVRRDLDPTTGRHCAARSLLGQRTVFGDHDDRVRTG
jgi:hypothetical protein